MNCVESRRGGGSPIDNSSRLLVAIFSSRLLLSVVKAWLLFDLTRNGEKNLSLLGVLFNFQTIWHNDRTFAAVHF